MMFKCGLLTATTCLIVITYFNGLQFVISSTSYFFNVSTQCPKRFRNILANGENMKTVLLWNRFFNEIHFGFGETGRAPFINAGCPTSNCVIWDQTDGDSGVPIEQFDAVLFHAIDESVDRQAPTLRSPHQLYIFFLLESPITYSLRHFPDDFFNLTASYRRDSDLFVPYGWITNMTTHGYSTPNKALATWRSPVHNTSISLPRKTKLVAWFVSNCYSEQSKRNEYVALLSKHVTVDVYGRCGNLTCSKSTRQQCAQMLEETYKFYLAFENSLCRDYVTEKFFRNIAIDIVPIVYGGSDYKDVAPPMSYIDVDDYDTPEHLAKHLIYLDENPDEYAEYFWWKSYYKVILNQTSSLLCQICNTLNSPPRKVYRSIADWWMQPGICHEPLF